MRFRQYRTLALTAIGCYIPRMAQTLGSRIKAARVARGWTQVEAARRLGIDPPVLCRYEKDGVDPKAMMLREIAHTYKVSADRLLGLRARR